MVYFKKQKYDESKLKHMETNIEKIAPCVLIFLFLTKCFKIIGLKKKESLLLEGIGS